MYCRLVTPTGRTTYSRSRSSPIISHTRKRCGTVQCGAVLHARLGDPGPSNPRLLARPSPSGLPRQPRPRSSNTPLIAGQLARLTLSTLLEQPLLSTKRSKSSLLVSHANLGAITSEQIPQETHPSSYTRYAGSTPTQGAIAMAVTPASPACNGKQFKVSRQAIA